MLPFDQWLPQALMDANLAELESIFQQTEDVEVNFSPWYLRERMKLLADPGRWIEGYSSRRRKLDWKLIALAAALLLTNLLFGVAVDLNKRKFRGMKNKLWLIFYVWLRF